MKESDRIIALQVANDILKGYGEFAGLPVDRYIANITSLAEAFVEWSEFPETEKINQFIDTLKP